MRVIQNFPSQVLRSPGEKPKRVKNLGWLLRNWNDVRHFTLRTHLSGEKLEGSLLIAWLASGELARYSCGWEGDREHVLQWLRRPVFHGLRCYVDPVGDAAKPETCTGEVVNL